MNSPTLYSKPYDYSDDIKQFGHNQFKKITIINSWHTTLIVSFEIWNR